jgi:hypothetical protein
MKYSSLWLSLVLIGTLASCTDVPSVEDSVPPPVDPSASLSELFVGVGTVSILADGDPKSSIVSGTLTDPNKAIVADVKVSFVDVGSDQIHIAQTDGRGRYELALPPGVYSLSTEKLGFCPQIWAPFRIEAGKQLLLNIPLFVCSIMTTVVVDEDPRNSGTDTEYGIPYKLDKIAFDNEFGWSKEMWIQYGAKSETESGTAYSRIVLEDGTRSRVRLTFNHIQVLANEIRKTSDSKFTAVGNVVIEDGEKRTESEKAILYFEKGQLQHDADSRMSAFSASY